MAELEEAQTPDGSPRIGACKTPTQASTPKHALLERVWSAQPQEPVPALLQQQQQPFVPLIPVRATHAAGLQARQDEGHLVNSPKELSDQVPAFYRLSFTAP